MVSLQGQTIALGIAGQSRAVVGELFDRYLEPERVDFETQSADDTLRQIANRYKIHHSEILKLNPRLKLGKRLRMGARVVIYQRDPEVASESVGDPGKGSLKGAVPIQGGPGRRITAHRSKRWGTSSTIARLDFVLRQWAKKYPTAPPILVNNLSWKKGGRLRPHGSHQSGRDVDLSYIERWDGKSEIAWRKMHEGNLDAELTWAFLKLLVAAGEVEVIFIDYNLQRVLHKHALEHGNVPAEDLKRWLQYPSGRHVKPRIIEHVKGHVDHIHVRFNCQANERRCRTRRRPTPSVQLDDVELPLFGPAAEAQAAETSPKEGEERSKVPSKEGGERSKVPSKEKKRRP